MVSSLLWIGCAICAHLGITAGEMKEETGQGRYFFLAVVFIGLAVIMGRYA